MRSKKFSRAVHKAGLHEHKTVQSGQKIKTKIQSTSLTGALKSSLYNSYRRKNQIVSINSMFVKIDK